MFAKCDKHYHSRYGQTSLARAVTNFTKSVTKINFGPSMFSDEIPNYSAPAPFAFGTQCSTGKL